jgi:hypothetical protein
MLPLVTPTKVGVPLDAAAMGSWILAFAGMTIGGTVHYIFG